MKCPLALVLCLVASVAMGMTPRARGQGPVVSTYPGVPTDSTGGTAFNRVVLDQIEAMPKGGGYSASHVATQRLGGSVRLTPLGFEVAAAGAEPSYCSGATYLVFVKTISALQRTGKLSLDPDAQRALLISGQRDGQGIWGRWNANGPGTARLFHELSLGRNFSDYAEARSGDFMKIFWNGAVGRKEHGHSVVFLGLVNDKGVESVRFWSSNTGTGYGEKIVPRSKIVFPIFSRLTSPENLARGAAINSSVDPYLAGLLTKDSDSNEVRRMCGM